MRGAKRYNFGYVPWRSFRREMVARKCNPGMHGEADTNSRRGVEKKLSIVTGESKKERERGREREKERERCRPGSLTMVAAASVPVG